MRILVLGATGFIGRHVVARLLQDGHRPIAAVRDVNSAKRRFPSLAVAQIDLGKMVQAADWSPFLAGVDAVINCAGILQSGRGQSAEAIHTAAPIALFDACVEHKVRRVIQISAVSADDAVGTEFARTKKAADDHLRSLDLAWTVLRPSLVYASGSFGGTSTLRGLAGFPLFIPVVGSGDQEFQPIHASDLAETVSRCLSNPALERKTLDPVGPETLSLKEILVRLRAWLDLPAVSVLHMPLSLVRGMARIGDFIGAGPIRTTSLEQVEYGNVSDAIAFEREIGFRPRSMEEAFRQAPSHVQDRWHARLYFLGPALTLALVILWIGSGVAGLLTGLADANRILGAAGVAESYRPIVAQALCYADIGVGLLIATGWRPVAVGVLQLLLVTGYTVALSAIQPELWLDPFGAIVKNLPILAAIAVWMAVRDEK